MSVVGSTAVLVGETGSVAVFSAEGASVVVSPLGSCNEATSGLGSRVAFVDTPSVAGVGVTVPLEALGTTSTGAIFATTTGVCVEAPSMDGVSTLVGTAGARSGVEGESRGGDDTGGSTGVCVEGWAVAGLSAGAEVGSEDTMPFAAGTSTGTLGASDSGSTGGCVVIGRGAVSTSATSGVVDIGSDVSGALTV